LELLRLAGQGDIKRFFDQIEEICGGFSGFDRVRMYLEDFVHLRQALQPLRAAYLAGPFGDDSYFDEALRTTRRREQAAD
jgi:hypothetical protein